MFSLKVLAQDGVEFTFLNTVHYRTSDGELDIIDDEGVITTTFADGEWVKVSREKDDTDDEWPVAVLRVVDYVDESEKEDGEDDYGASLIRGGEQGGMLGTYHEYKGQAVLKPRGFEDHELP